MRHLLGFVDADYRQRGALTPFVLNTDQLINAHMLITGMSGTGKSWQIMQLLKSASREGVQVDVIDSHEELDGAPSSAAVKFSRATRVGFNPLVLNTDPHSGGVYAQIGWLIDMINRTSRKLGPRQETALANLLQDVYAMRGIFEDNAQSWVKQQITEQRFDEMIRARDYQGLRAYYPILRDVISYGERKLKALTLGTDNKAVGALERVEACAQRLTSLTTRYQKAHDDAEVKKLANQIDSEREKAIDAYAAYVSSIETGREFQDVRKYSDRDTLVSVLERLDMLQQEGTFCSNPPDWRGAAIRVHQVGSLKDDSRRLLFYNRAEQALRESMDAGKSDRLRRIFLVDEGAPFYSEDADNPMNKISNEGRKFGLSLVVCSQSPTHFSEDFLGNVGTIVNTGINGQYWKMACNKLQIDESILRATRPREVMSVKLNVLGQPNTKFVSVNVDQAVFQQALLARRAA